MTAVVIGGRWTKRGWLTPDSKSLGCGVASLLRLDHVEIGRLGRLGDVVSWSDLRIYQVISQMPSESPTKDTLHRAVRHLLDTHKHGVLVETLETYLDHAGDAAATARVLSLHRTSPYDRLDRIKKLTGVDLGFVSGHDRLALHLSLKIARLGGLLRRLCWDGQRPVSQLTDEFSLQRASTSVAGLYPHVRHTFLREGRPMPSLMVDFITSLDGYGGAEGWPGYWGLEGPEYLGWLEEQEEHTVLMGATTYRLMSGFAAEMSDLRTPEESAFAELTAMPKVVFSSTLQAPLSWANTELVAGNAVEAVRAMKRDGTRALRTLGSLTLCRTLLEGGVVDRFRVVVFPVITGVTGRDRIYDEYPDLSLDLVASRTFDGRLQLLEYVPTVLDGPPGAAQSND